ncbi:replication initiator protein A [Lacipirellula parvula]|uniref:Replication initiator protein A n=1 Tax=Lacipirellula parvula TaxID=2650471 RepID=A0A5K7XJ03_9BACT|nr:replication initiator protein A [Lacipirellula parvula]BBO34183.1 hypothetical protein PLANPX_3795 [Lacipirellula parvula]
MEEQLREETWKPLWNFDLTDGRDELNLAEFPLAAIANRVPQGQKTFSFEDQVWDEGAKQKVNRKLTISGSDQFGLPTARDNDVLLALIHLTKCRNSFREPTVHFTRYELVKFLKWDDGGKSYRRLEHSLNVLASVTLFYNRAWWDLKGKSWRNRTFHILESVDLRGRESVGAGEQPLSSLTWNGTIFASFAANYIKKLNLEVYFQLDGAAARQAYRFLDKRFYHKRRWEFDIRVFACEHLGLSRSYDTGQLKRKLEPAFQELERIHFIKPMSRHERFVKRGPGNWIVIAEKSEKQIAVAEEKGLGRSAAKLVERGVTRTVAEEIATEFSAGQIERQIAAFDQLPKEKRLAIKNGGGYLVRAIRADYSVSPASKLEAKEVLKPREIQLTVEDRKRESRRAYWKGLSVSEKAAIEKLAFEHADSFVLSGWERALESGSEALTTGYRNTIIDQELDRMLCVS